ncbi:unnamed protein product [Brassica napus]|uniref:(rape) hypothetical protein n=1 Tax=Brassica napus TaxID=3708 RepID=A0A816LZ78_BRANA|nr:unnamed protein product [Brassica napus]
MFGSHERPSDDVPVIEGLPASTDPAPAHTDSVITSTETPLMMKRSPVQIKLAKSDHSTMETWNSQNTIEFHCLLQSSMFSFNNAVIHILK